MDLESGIRKGKEELGILLASKCVHIVIVVSGRGTS